MVVSKYFFFSFFSASNLRPCHLHSGPKLDNFCYLQKNRNTKKLTGETGLIFEQINKVPFPLFPFFKGKVQTHSGLS